MNYLQIDATTTLEELTEIVGADNIDQVLHINELDRVPNIGAQIIARQIDIEAQEQSVDWQRKSTVINRFSGDSDLFELASTLTETEWKLLSSRDIFPGTIKLPEGVTVPDSSIILGNGVRVPNLVYTKVMEQLESEEFGHTIDPSIFSEYSAILPTSIIDPGTYTNVDVYKWFKIPWGDVTLYSSLSKSYVDFPVYPEEMSDGVVANYSTMPELIYQYEPWQLYTSSGPRENTYTFNFHRDMWTGNHADGLANKLIRFCEANCYPRYSGSAVNTALVTLYVKGKALITGVMTKVNVDWSGPLGDDGWYLMCKLTITIVEVSQEALSYDVIMNKPLIG